MIPCLRASDLMVKYAMPRLSPRKSNGHRTKSITPKHLINQSNKLKRLTYRKPFTNREWKSVLLMLGSGMGMIATRVMVNFG